MLSINIVCSPDTDRVGLVYDIYKTCLTYDMYWHFFDEGEYGIELRFNDHYRDNIKKYLDDRGFQYRNLIVYDRDDNIVVTEFFNLFLNIFHNSSMLAMTFYEKYTKKYSDEQNTDILVSIAERTLHSMCNNSKFVVENTFVKDAIDKFNEPECWESFLLNRISMDRSIYAGIRHLYKKGWRKV